MIKKLCLILITLSLLLCVGCSEETPEIIDNSSKDNITESNQSEIKNEVFINNLTGLQDVTKENANRRPVAIMINNINVAQRVQTGLNMADIVYETEVEGGITRLLAIYKDLSSVKKIGTIRSARYDYIDLAMGHDAIYVHHGLDKTYAAPHLKHTDTFEVTTSNGGTRFKNGLSSEHTLYGDGGKIWNNLTQKFSATTKENAPMWQNFATEEITFNDIANVVSVYFSNQQKTVFKYDSAAKEYIRYTNITEIKDYETGESIHFKNIFVLNTNIGNRPDNYHKNISLESGDGYYIVNGTYTPIKWSKGDAANPFKFTNIDGSELIVNAGRSWVCIADKNRSKPIFE